MNYQIERNEKHCVVSILGDIDIDGTEMMSEELPKELEGFEDIVVSFQDVLFVDSTGIGLIIELIQTLKEQDKQVKITNVNPAVYEIFELLQVPEIIGTEVFDVESE